MFRHRPRREEVTQPLQILGVKVPYAGGGDQRRFRLKKIGAVDGE
jgi:hypothetical protein